MSILETKEKHCSGKERDKRMDDLLELTEDMEREISNALGHGPQDEVLSSAFKLRITRGDIQTLKNYHWLNDEVINFYMNLLVERNKKQGYPALHAFSTFFYPKLKSGGYQAVKRWTKGVNLFEQELILVPIHRKVHWSLVVIDLRKRCLKYLDSMGQKGHRICEILLQYLQDESKTKRNIDLNLLEWTHYSMKPHEIPQQLNGSDCGMFTCKYADYISRDKPITFTQVSGAPSSPTYLLSKKMNSERVPGAWCTVRSEEWPLCRRSCCCHPRPWPRSCWDRGLALHLLLGFSSSLVTSEAVCISPNSSVH